MPFTSIDNLERPSGEDNKSLFVFARKAKDFLLSFKWCLDIQASFLVHGWDGILGVFYFQIVPHDSGVSRKIWVVFGDIPPAYLINEEFKHPSEVLEAYVHEMRRWVLAVESGQPIDELIPVYYANGNTQVPATKEFAAALASRLTFIEEDLIPEVREVWRP
jgi:hypothetical protein